MSCFGSLTERKENIGILRVQVPVASTWRLCATELVHRNSLDVARAIVSACTLNRRGSTDTRKTTYTALGQREGKAMLLQITGHSMTILQCDALPETHVQGSFPPGIASPNRVSARALAP